VPEEIRWIPAQTDARVDRILIHPGALVKPETVILELTNPSLQREVLDAQYQLKATEADYENLKVQVGSELLNQKSVAATVRSEYEQTKLQHSVDEQLHQEGLGADVIITEIDPVKGIEAVMDGFRVMPMADAVKEGDVFITVTGNKNVIRREHFEIMKSGAIVCNSGHFNVEIEIPALEDLSASKREVRPLVDEFQLKDGRKIYLIGEGRLVNLATAEGHPAAVMDMSFANQSLSAEYLMKHHKELKPQVYVVPENIDREIAKLKLESMGHHLDKLTAEQEHYLASWQEGT